MRNALVFLVLTACSDDNGSSFSGLLPATDDAICFALGADYTNNVGLLAAVGIPSGERISNLLPGSVVQADAVLRSDGERLFVISRVADTVTVIGRDDSELGWRVEQQFSTGAQTNPQDVARVGDKLYVTLYGAGELRVRNLETGAESSIDLSSYDPDGNPDASSIGTAGGRLLVTLGLLDWSSTFPVPRGDGKAAIIDPASDAVTGDIALPYTNPYGFMFPWNGGVVAATVADYSGIAGCVHELTIDPPSQRCLAENAALGGTVSAIAVAPDAAFLAVSAADFLTAHIRRLDAEGALQEGALNPDAQVVTDVAWAPTNHLLYADSAVGGLRLYDVAAGAETTAAPIDIGLPPVFANGMACLPR